jgi:RNA-directed DNA polymerase
MAQQKSDGRVVPEDSRKRDQIGGGDRRRGGKATTVEQQDCQLRLRFGTAEKAAERSAVLVERADRGKPRSATIAGPQPKSREETGSPATMMMRVVERLPAAFQKVAKNDGAPGPDRQSVEQVRKHLADVLTKLGDSLLEGSYRVGDIRRVWIPKAGGGQRGLGIPNVVDRVVQEALRQEIEPQWEPTFAE